MILHHQQLDDESAMRSHKESERPSNPFCDTDPAIPGKDEISSCETGLSEFQKSNKMYGYEEWSIIPICGTCILERH